MDEWWVNLETKVTLVHKQTSSGDLGLCVRNWEEIQRWFKNTWNVLT